MITLNENDSVDIIGPLGNGYPEAQPENFLSLLQEDMETQLCILKQKN